MNLKALILEQIADAKREGDDKLIEMLEYRLEQLESPVSAQELFMSAPISNQRDA